MNNVYNEPKYDTDVANKGYVDKQIGDAVNGVEEDIDAGLNGKTKNFAVQPAPPYRVGDTWTSDTGMYVCVTERLIGSYTASDWEVAKAYDNTKSVLDGGITTDGTLVVAKGGTVAAGLTAYDSGDNQVRFWAGSTIENRATAPFRVTQAGKLYAYDAEITGGNIKLHSNNINNVTFKTYLDGYENSVYASLNPNIFSMNNSNFHCSMGFAAGTPSIEASRTSGNTSYLGQVTSDFIWAVKMTGSTQIISQIAPEEITTPKITAGNIDCGTCNLNKTTDTQVSFNKTFASVPIVILTCTQNNTGSNVYAGSVIATTTAGFTAFCMTNATSASNISFNWIAIGT